MVGQNEPNRKCLMNLRSTLYLFPCMVFLTALICDTSATQEMTSSNNQSEKEIATFAGGCFWCVESDFDQVPGVIRTISGYTGGTLANPSYKQVASGGTGHVEAVQIVYDPNVISFETLLDVFWHSVDPTDEHGQFCDRGESYITGVFANSLEQKRLAEFSKQELAESGTLEKPVATLIKMAGPFYPAEDYHQDYYKKNPIRYELYRFRCGRDRRLRDIWGEEAHRGITKK